MANLTRTFIKGRMNKEVTERLVPAGEYIDALNQCGRFRGSNAIVLPDKLG